MNTIVVGTDLTPASDRTLRGAASFARHTGGALHVVHPLGLVGIPLRDALRLLDGDAVQLARRALADQIGRALCADHPPHTMEVDLHQTRHALVHRARKVQADLIVTGAVGGEISRVGTLWETARWVAWHSGIPVLFVAAAHGWPVRRVVCALGVADLAHRATLTGAGAWLTRLQAGVPAGAAPPADVDLEALHVASDVREWRAIAPLFDRAMREVETDALLSTPVRLRRHVRWGASVAERILSFQAEDEPEMLVLGAGRPERGAGESGRRATGPAILRESRSPVLLVPERHGAGGPGPPWETDDAAYPLPLPLRP